MAKQTTRKLTVEERATTIASAMVEASLSALNKQAPNKPDLWTKVLIGANVSLAIFAFSSVLITFNMVSEMKKQNELARQNLQETLRPHLLMRLDTILFHDSPFGGHPANTITAKVVIQNNGSIPAELELISLDAFPYSRLEANARDSLLKTPLDSSNLSKDSGSLSKFIPPHSSISFVAVIQDISGRIRPDGTFYIHYIILFTDAFGLLRDVYSVTRCNLDLSKHAIGAHPSSYSYHNYTESEKQYIFRKSEHVLGH